MLLVRFPQGPTSNYLTLINISTEAEMNVLSKCSAVFVFCNSLQMCVSHRKRVISNAHVSEMGTPALLLIKRTINGPEQK